MNKLKTITFDFVVPMRETFEVNKLSPDFQRYLEIWMKDEDDRTDDEWDFIENNSLSVFVGEELGYDCVDEVDCYSLEREEE